MKCPVCLVGVHESWEFVDVAHSVDGSRYEMRRMACPECKSDLILVEQYKNDALLSQYYAVPQRPTREKMIGIPEKYARLYQDASDVLEISPRASAALSRACLQLLLREYGGVEPSSLVKEIDQVLASNSLPVRLAQTINAIRQMGNYAVHPDKRNKLGETVDIDEGEAEWGLEILKDLFEHYITKPKEQSEKMKAFKDKYE